MKRALNLFILGACVLASGMPAAVAAAASPRLWKVHGQEPSGFASSVASAGDVNGDGYDDVIVGAPGYMQGAEGMGGAVVYLGSVAGLDATPAWKVVGDQFNGQVGWSVSSAGDVNGDGFDDVILGAWTYTDGQQYEGAAFLYQGSAAGLATTPAWMGEDDQAYSWFGWSVSSAGDVNGDGFDDVIVGAKEYGDSSQGAAFGYLGSAAGLGITPDWAVVGDQPFTTLGASVAQAGDVNGDGFDDVAVGAPWYSNGQNQEGRALVYHGSASGLSTTPDWTAESDQAIAEFGHSVASAGDVNGDGYDDLVVGAPYYDNGQSNEGAAVVFYGSASGLGATRGWRAFGDQHESALGGSVASAGDENGDGFDDLLIGVAGYGGDEAGGVLGFEGSGSGLEHSPTWTPQGTQANSSFGWSVAPAGDVNGDGFADALVGSPSYSSPFTGYDVGIAIVFYGRP